MSASDIYLPSHIVKVIYNSFLLVLENFFFFLIYIYNLGPNHYNLTSVSLGLLPTILHSWGLLSITICQFLLALLSAPGLTFSSIHPRSAAPALQLLICMQFLHDLS